MKKILKENLWNNIEVVYKKDGSVPVSATIENADTNEVSCGF